MMDGIVSSIKTMATMGLIKMYAVKENTFSTSSKPVEEEMPQNIETFGCIFNRMDSYPSALGYEIFTFLKDITITNGISSNTGKTANGPGCLYAQLVTHLKNKNGGMFTPGSNVGGVYLSPIELSHDLHDYVYKIYVHYGKFCSFKETTIIVNNGAEMNIKDFGIYCLSK